MKEPSLFDIMREIQSGKSHLNSRCDALQMEIGKVKKKKFH